jgi:hypothetical protein
MLTLKKLPIKKVGGLAESSGALQITSGGGIGIPKPRVFAERSVDSLESADSFLKPKANNYQSNTRSQSKINIGN